MSKETGLTVYDDSPLAQFFRKIQNFPTMVHNFLFPQAAKPLAGEQGNSFPDDKEVHDALYDDIIRFLEEVSKEEITEKANDEITTETEKETEKEAEEPSSKTNMNNRGNIIEVKVREEDDVPLVTTSRLDKAIRDYNMAIKVGDTISHKKASKKTKGKRSKGKHTKDNNNIER